MNIRPCTLLSLAVTLTAFTYLPAAPAVIVDVESGDRAIRVESWDTQHARWNSVAQAHLSGSPGTVKIALPDTIPTDPTLRVSSLDSPLVPEFILAQHAFGLPEKPADAAQDSSPAGRDYYAPGIDFSNGGTEEESGDQVLEADLWQRVGNRLYFFNQYRGLQVIDISDSSAPELVGSYRLPAQGEEMYPLSNDRLLLLAGSYSDGTQVHLLDVSGNDPVLLHTTEKFDGYYQDSRLVGSRLHMVQRQHYIYDADSPTDYYRSRWQLQTLDYSNGTAPVIAEPTEYTQSGYHNAITVADSQYLFIILPHDTYSSPDGIRSRIIIYKLDTANGLPLPLGLIHTTGQIGDKTKIYRNGGTLVTVSQSRTAATNRQPITHFETFNLAAPNLPRFDAVTLAPDETLFATRFSGTRAYVVTFLIKDPLFALDFSDPADIQILGQLDIPGYSTWMQVIGNQLISVGVEESRVAISLFDVADPANMFLADRLYIGEPGGYSWSEANYDDRAVTLDVAQQRVMIPYQSYGEQSSTAALALVGYSGGELTLEGSIDFAGTPPRRGQIYGNQLIALSGKDLKIASLEQSPLQISASLPVSWNVSQIEVHNEYLVQFVPHATNYWYFYQPWLPGQSEPLKMYVTSTSEPDHVLAEIVIPGDFLLGTFQTGNDLYTLTAAMAEDDSYTVTSTRWNSTSLPQLDAEITWVSEKVTDSYPGNASYAADLIDGHVVWYPTALNQYYLYPWAYGGIDFAATDAAIRRPYPYYYQNSFSSAWVHPVQATSANVIAQHVFSQTQLHQTSFWKSPYLYLATWKEDPFFYDKHGQHRYVREWQVWDFSKPTTPPVAHEFPLPGEPVGVYRYNAETDLLLSSKWEHDSNSETQTWTQTLQLQVWDGIQAFTAFSQVLPETEYNYNNPLFDDGFFFSTSYNYSDDGPASSALEILQLDYQQGAFVQHQSIPFEGYIQQLDYRHDTLWIRAQNSLFAGQRAGDTWHASAQLPVSSYLPLNFSTSRETTPGTILIPAGDYGVETVNLPGIVTTALQMSSHSEEPASGWTILPQSRWYLSATEEATPIGKITQRKWLFQPSGNQPLLTQSESVADYWRYLDNFGMYFEGEVAQWRYHADYGWLQDAGEHQGGRLLLHPISGWFWIHENLLPHAYNLNTQTWIIW